MQFVAGAPEFIRKLIGGRSVAARRLEQGRFGVVAEGHEVHGRGSAGTQRSSADFHPTATGRRFDQTVPDCNSDLPVGRPLQSRPHRPPDLFVGKGQQVEGWCACREHEEPGRVAVDVDDLPGFIYGDCRRGVTVEERATDELGRDRRARPDDDRNRVRRNTPHSGRDGRKVEGAGAGRPDPAVDAVLLVDRFEVPFGRGGRLGRAEHQRPTLAQAEVQQGEYPLLGCRLKVDQQVAAGDDIEPRERRILQDVLRGEDHEFPKFLLHAVEAVVLVEEPSQTLRRYFALDSVREDPGPGCPERPLGHVGCEHLDIEPFARHLGRFGDEHGQTVCFLTGSTCRHPAPDFRTVRSLGDQRVEDFLPEDRPHFRVAEEPGHMDQQVVGQCGHFGRRLSQGLDVVGNRGELAQSHTATDSAQDRRFAVPGEVVPGSGP